MSKSIFEETNKTDIIDTLLNSKFNSKILQDLQNLSETDLCKLYKKNSDAKDFQNDLIKEEYESPQAAKKFKPNEITSSSPTTSTSMLKIAQRLRKLTETTMKLTHLEPQKLPKNHPEFTDAQNMITAMPTNLAKNEFKPESSTKCN